MLRIERLEVEGFRGITKVCALPLNGKSLLIFGENGTGKSSFLNALERLFTGKVQTLEGRMSVSTDRHGPNIRASGPPRISVQFSEGTQFDLDSDLESLPKDLKEYLVAANQPLYILGRRQILDFIEQQPRERYEQLSSFIPLEDIETTENALRTLFQSAENNFGRAEQSLRNASDQMADALDIGDYTIPMQEDQVCGAISTMLEQLDLPSIKKISEIQGVLTILDARLEKFGDTERLITLHDAQSKSDELYTSFQAMNLKSFTSALEKLRIRELVVAETFFEDVLQRGLEWIEIDWTGQCPLCETPWDKKPHDRQELVSRIRERLDKMKEVVTLRHEAEKERQRMLEGLRNVLEKSQSLRSDLETLKESDGQRLMKEIVRNIEQTRSFVDQRIDRIDTDILHSTVNSLYEGDYANKVQGIRTHMENTYARLPSVNELRPFIELKSLLSGAGKLWSHQTEVFNKSKKAKRRMEIASILLTTAQDSRKEVIQEIFDQISQDMDRLYAKATGNQKGLSQLRLEIRPEMRASAVLHSDFYNQQKVVPNAYGSDGQLDILGLCTFLALRKWYKRQCPSLNLLILDDVLTSVDAQHALRTAELILNEFNDYQILLTTHDRIWYEYLRDIQARCRVRAQFINKVIHKWTLEDGPDICEPEDERKRLETLLSTGEPREIASEAGQLLEHVLQEMRYSLRLPIQARRGERYEIGEIWPAFYKISRKNYGGFYAACQETMDSLDVRWTIRNWVGSHFNHWAKRVSREEVLEFGITAGDLFDKVFCKDCRRFIEPSMTPAGQLSCRCGHLIYPAPGKKALKPSARTELVKLTKGAFKDATFSTDLYFKWKREEIRQENN